MEKIKNKNNEEYNDKIYLNVLYAKKNSTNSNMNSRIHFHPFTEFYFLTSGKGTFSIEDKNISVKMGDFLIINSNIGHSIYPFDNKTNLEYISFGVDSIYVSKTSDSNELEAPKFFYKNVNNYANKFLKAFTEILYEFNSDTPYSKSMANAKASIALINILREFNGQIVISNDKKTNKQIDYIKNYIDNNYSTDIKLENLSKMAYMNKFHLIAEFKQSYRVTPIEYLILKRIEVTKNLLISTNHSMEEISSIVGFNSQSYFNQVFRKKVGITPSRFRKNHRI